MVTIKGKKEYFIKKAIALLLSLAIICSLLGINAFAYTSFTGIEIMKNSDETFVILEIVPQANSGSIGFYIAGEESLSADVASETEYNTKVSNLDTAGLYAEDGSAPLSPAQRIYPWQETSGAVKIDLGAGSAETVEVTGVFTENIGGGNFNLTSPNNYEYIETPTGDYDFTEGTGAGSITATISYSHYFVTKAYTNNNWFKSLILGDANSTKTIEVNSLIPSAFNTDETAADSLTSQIEKADLIVLSAGIDAETNTSLENSYATNDFSTAQTQIIQNAVNSGKAIVLDSSIAGVEIPATPGGTATPANIAALVESIIGTNVTTNGYVSGNVYCFTQSTTPERLHFATSNFNLAFDDALTQTEGAPYYEVHSEIQAENDLREQALNGGTAPADYYIPTEISMAAALRHIINLAYNVNAPEIQITDSTGANVLSNILIPTIYRESLASTGGDTLLLTDANKQINIKYNDNNTVNRQTELYVYYEDIAGDYYLSTDATTSTNSMLPYSSSAPSGAQRFSRIIDGIGNTKIDEANTDASAIVDLVFEDDLPDAVFDYFEGINENGLSVYISATSTIGFRQYSALSNELRINKLGLFMIG